LHLAVYFLPQAGKVVKGLHGLRILSLALSSSQPER